MKSPDPAGEMVILDQNDSLESNRPARVKKIKSYEEEDSEAPLPSKKKKKLSHSKIPDVTVPKTKKISFSEAIIHSDENSQPTTGLVKRPRGRPPLVMNKPRATPKPALPTRASLPPVAPINAKVQSLQYIPSIPKQYPLHAPVFHQNPPPHETEFVKPVRPSVALMTERVISKLMTSDPLSASELVTRLSDAPREIVQSVLDVLHVMGIVMAVKMRDSDSTSAASHSSSANLYSLTGYARTQSAIRLCSVGEDTAAKVEQHGRTKARMAALHELTMREGMTSLERTVALTALLDRFLAEDPCLWEDPLYRAIVEQTGNVYQPPSSQQLPLTN